MENNNRTWEALSMKDRASFIKLAIQNGYRDLNSIREMYNTYQYKDGGKVNTVSKQPPTFNSQNMPGYNQVILDRLNQFKSMTDTMRLERQAAIIAGSIHESNLDPEAVGDNGKATGILQFHPNRRNSLYNKKGTPEEMLKNQATAIMDALSGRDPNNAHWTHGGKGSGYDSWKDARRVFYDDNSTLEEVNNALNRGFIRPANASKRTKERFETTKKIYEILKNSKDLGGPLYNQDNPIEAFQGNPYIPIVRYENGGGIYIKPSKRGSFTAAARRRNMGVQEFAAKVLANKENYSSAMVKKANFAKNAKKWKH